MIENVKNLVKNYYEWLTSRADVIELKGSDWILVGTPFENFMGDLIDLYIRIENNEIIISDRGETLSNLESAGIIEINRSKNNRSKKRKETLENMLTFFILKSILASYGVMTDGEAIFVKATEKDFVKKKHRLIQAILRVNEIAKPY